MPGTFGFPMPKMFVRTLSKIIGDVRRSRSVPGTFASFGSHGNMGNMGGGNMGTRHFYVGKHGDTTLLGNMGTRHFYVRSRFPETRFEISARTAREIGPACLFRFKSFEISADKHLCRRSHNEKHFRIGRRERCLDSRSIELAMRFRKHGDTTL